MCAVRPDTRKKFIRFFAAALFKQRTIKINGVPWIRIRHWIHFPPPFDSISCCFNLICAWKKTSFLLIPFFRWILEIYLGHALFWILIFIVFVCLIRLLFFSFSPIRHYKNSQKQIKLESALSSSLISHEKSALLWLRLKQNNIKSAYIDRTVNQKTGREKKLGSGIFVCDWTFSTSINLIPLVSLQRRCDSLHFFTGSLSFHSMFHVVI